MKPFLLIVAALLLSVLAFSQTDSVADQVRALDKQQRESALRGESSFEELHTTNEYISINPAGVLSTREQALARLKSSDVKLQSIDVDQEEAHVYGDTVVITGRDHVRGTYKGQVFDQTSRYARVWIKQNGAWKLALFQETPLAER